MEGKRQLEKRDFGKRLSLDSSLVEYMDSNKYLEHLLTQLEEQHRNLWREKLAVAQLQREVAQRRSEGAMHEKLIHELEEERHLRLQSEQRLQEVTLESERNRIQMRGLQQQFSRMEETVRILLQSQGPPEQKKEDTVNMMVYQEKLLGEERKHKEGLEDLHMVVDEDFRSGCSSTEEGKEKTKLLLERLKALEAENSALALENENQREQYERCLDEVASQVVQALLTQKDLREECLKLKTRVFDLEQQNQTLSILFQQQVRPASEVLLKEHQLNTKSGAPALKCPGFGLTIPSHLCPPNSCSSSELSLSSTCSEYSSGSSYTWHDGKTPGKRQSSEIWEKRLSIGLSLPSSVADRDELPPTRIKESHILEGLRKLQKRKALLEPPSVITKWGYKDCMNSNEGIYSPGIKCSSLNECPASKPTDTCKVPLKDPHKTFVYDTDSHDDAEEDSSSLALLQALPNEGCRLHRRKLTQRVSDRLFGWELSGNHFLEGAASAYPRERPQKLSTCVRNCPLEGNLCPRLPVPPFPRVRGQHSQGYVALGLQLSDTDDCETLDELYIESSDEKSPSDLSLPADTDQSLENLDLLLGLGRSQFRSPEEKGKPVSIYLESRPKTCGFIKEQVVVRRTSSEECMTVIFDAQDGEPIEFSSHQVGVVTVTGNEISINQHSSEPTVEHTDILPQGILHLQPGTDARDYTFLNGSEEETEKTIPNDQGDNIPLAPTESFSPRTVTQNNTQQQKLAKPRHNMSCQSNSRSSVSLGIYQKQSLTKIPARGKSSSQKSKIMAPEASTIIPSADTVTFEKSPAFAPGKRSQFRRAESPAHLFDLRTDSHIPKLLPKLPHNSKIPSRRDCSQCSQSPGSRLLSRSLIEPRDNGEPLTREGDCDSGPDAGEKSPPPPPGRSLSLLVRPSYDCSSPLSSTKPETRVPSETAKTVSKFSPLKGLPTANISSDLAMTEVQGKKPSVAFKNPVIMNPPPSTQTVVQTRCPGHPNSSLFSVAAPGPLKVSPKRGIPKTSPHQTLGTTQMDTGLRSPKNCPFTHEALETLSSKSASPERKGQLNDCVPPSPKSSFLGPNESPPSQANSPSPSPSYKSNSAPHGGPSAHEKGLQTRLPVGLSVLLNSPQLLRKSSTVPEKHEKDSLNEASKSSVSVSKAKQEEEIPTSIEGREEGGNVAALGLQTKDTLAEGLPLENGLPEPLENCVPRTDGRIGMDKKSVKRSLSSSKPHLKPALGMNGAKARSQSFSIYSGDKPSTPPVEGPGKVRTQIITNTAERRSSLTRQNSFMEGLHIKPPLAAAPDSLPNSGRPRGSPSSRQGSLGSTDSSRGQHGSPSKLPLRILPEPEGLLRPPGSADQHVYTPGGCSSVHKPEEPHSNHCSCPSTPLDSPRVLQSPGMLQRPSSFETSRTPQLETSGKHPDASTTRPDTVSPEAPLSPTIEEKVMLCIQENVEKGQVQTKSTSVETKQKPGPSFASWFGFRKSRLPALSSRKIDVPKTKVEKKDIKGLGFANKHLRSERKKDKKKPELQCEIENELNRETESTDSPDISLQSKHNMKPRQDIYNQMKLEPRNRLSPVTCSTKDTFMTELLNRVDKRAVQQAESGSNNVSYRNMFKGSSQGSCLPGSSIGTQGNHKKNIKTKADVEISKSSLIKEANGNLQEDEEDTAADSTFQSHIIESSCQMRTLDSGIGTFPLPDSGNRSTGRYICKPDPLEDIEPPLSAASTIRAQTLDREVPSSADSLGSADTTIVHSMSDPIMTTRGVRPPQSRLPKPVSSGKIASQKQNEAEPRPQTCPSFEYAENTVASDPDWGCEDTADETQDKVPRMCAYSASQGNAGDSDVDYGDPGFGAGRGKLVKAMKSATKEIETS